jgi:hypothetical protein
VTFRLLHADSSMGLAYLHESREPNPALGRAGMRALLSRELVLRRQLAAILRAGASGPVRIALPFVTDAGELRRAKELVFEERLELRKRREKHAERPQVGVIVETAAALLGARDLARESDFMLVNLDALTQHLLGADRDNLELKGWFEALHPCVMRALRTLVEVCAELGKPLGAFGVTATARQNLPFLVGVGLREFSAEPSDLRSIGNALDRIPTRTAQRAGQRARRQLVPGGDALAGRGLEARLRAFLSLFQRKTRSSTPLAGRTTCALAGGDAFPSSAFSAAATACTCASSLIANNAEPLPEIVASHAPASFAACSARAPPGMCGRRWGTCRRSSPPELEQVAVSRCAGLRAAARVAAGSRSRRPARRCAARASARSSSRASRPATRSRNATIRAVPGARRACVRPATGSDSTQPPNSAAVTLSGWPSRASASSSNSSRLTVRGPALAPSTSPRDDRRPRAPQPAARRDGARHLEFECDFLRRPGGHEPTFQAAQQQISRARRPMAFLTRPENQATLRRPRHDSRAHLQEQFQRQSGAIKSRPEIGGGAGDREAGGGAGGEGLGFPHDRGASIGLARPGRKGPTPHGPLWKIRGISHGWRLILVSTLDSVRPACGGLSQGWSKNRTQTLRTAAVPRGDTRPRP